MKVLITGIYGQDGIILQKKFHYKNFKTFGFAKSKKNISLCKNTKIILDDLSNIFRIAQKIRAIKPDLIIHLASNNVGASLSKNFYHYYLYNLLSYMRLFIVFIIFAKNAKFILAGSSMMYDNLKNIKINERTNFNTKSYYGLYKIHCHKISIFFKFFFKLNYTTLILFNHDSIYRNKNFLIPRIVLAIKNKNYNFIKKIYKENIQLDSSHAEDFCEAITKICLSKNNLDKVILSSGKITKLSLIIKNALKNKIKLPTKNKKKDYLLGDCSLLKKLFKFKHEKSTNQAFKEISKKFII